MDVQLNRVSYSTLLVEDTLYSLHEHHVSTELNRV